MEQYNLDDFLKLSAVLNYQLSAKDLNWNNVMAIVLEGKTVPPEDEAVLLHVFQYLGRIYGKTRRDLGPFSVLHPLRATALLSRASQSFSLLDIMTCLLHDHFEDFKPPRPGTPAGSRGDERFQVFLKGVPPRYRPRLRQHLQWLTKDPAETYNRYIGKLLDQACRAPEVVRIKLSDRLDNTLDMRIDLQDPLQGVDFFEVIFETFFTNTYQGYRPERRHRTTSVLNGAQRLYQLFKNIVLMSLVRQREVAADAVSQDLFRVLAKASIREAQRIALHVFGYHETAVTTLREVLRDTMAYAQSGGFDGVTEATRGHRLDGLLMSVFDQPRKEERKRQLAGLYHDKVLMLEVAVAFVAIFLNFLNDGSYFVHGISAEGIRPDPACRRPAAG